MWIWVYNGYWELFGPTFSKGAAVSQISDTQAVEEDRQQSFVARFRTLVIIFFVVALVAALFGLMFMPEAVKAINHTRL